MYDLFKSRNFTHNFPSILLNSSENSHEKSKSSKEIVNILRDEIFSGY